jgi:symplekin
MTDPNVAMVPSDHPFMHVPSIEQEAIRLLQSVINLLYTSTLVCRSRRYTC